MCQAIMAKSREGAMQKNINANILIGQLVTDLTQDNSTTENLERIKKKLNEVLVKYKQKVDFKVSINLSRISLLNAKSYNRSIKG